MLGGDACLHGQADEIGDPWVRPKDRFALGQSLKEAYSLVYIDITEVGVVYSPSGELLAPAARGAA